MGFDDFNMDDEYMEEGPLPGFRFHPTDEELVGFYLRRKLDKKPISLELIKQIDIYKYDPWDLPRGSCITSGEKEWYFFCKRGRKYKNSIRPNRVTSSGFWKATGIDKQVHSLKGDCIGLKKTLVYYRGSAGKGTKTDWMMHEFRLPSNIDNNNNAPIAQEAEIWTLCRILKRNASKRKQFTTELKQLGTKRTSTVAGNANREDYISFGHNYNNDHNKHVINYDNTNSDQKMRSPVAQQATTQLLTAPPASNFWISPVLNDLFDFDNWDELGSVFAVDSPIM